MTGLPDPSSLRILEIGSWSYCADVYPDSTTVLWTGDRQHPAASTGRQVYDCTLPRLIRALRDARAGKYDLVVAYMPLQAAWHPRYWLRSLLRNPRQPWTALTRVFGVAWLRFLRVPVPLAVLDMNDAFSLRRHNFFLLDRATAAFKRELPADRWHVLAGTSHPAIPTRRIRRNPTMIRRMAKLHPIALPIAPLDTTDVWSGDEPEKTTDLFFSGDIAENSWVRLKGLAELEALRAREITIDIPRERLSHREFLRRMSKAWLAWSPSGYSWECYRTGEAAQCLTVPVLNYPTVERQHPLRDGEHVIFYDLDDGGLVRAVEAALADKARLRKMALAARDHVRRHHLQRAVVDHVVATTRAAAAG